MLVSEILKAILIGIVEGVTEWLPISSTGHMILLDEFINLDVSAAFRELFFVVIQLGAILAVPILFFEKLNPFSWRKSRAEKKNTAKLWFKVLVGVTPAALLGVLLDDICDKYLYRYQVVALALIIYGIIFIFIEKFSTKITQKYDKAEDLSYADALKIGAFQILSLVPGTSRSGSTIIAGLLLSASRSASAEFSFFMAIPIMFGISALKILKFALGGLVATANEIAILLIGMAVSFFVSYISIKFLLDFVKRQDFKLFGIYRIILGIIVLLYFATK